MGIEDLEQLISSTPEVRPSNRPGINPALPKVVKEGVFKVWPGTRNGYVLPWRAYGGVDDVLAVVPPVSDSSFWNQEVYRNLLVGRRPLPPNEGTGIVNNVPENPVWI
jgi:hypothetical protein